MSNQSTSVQGQSSFFSELWDRRVPHIVGSYLVGSFGFIQFLEWGATRSMFSLSWTLMVFRFLAVVLPSVIMFAWFHGRPGPDKWQKIEKIFIPLNFLTALAAVLLLSSSTPFLRPEQERVFVKDENGNKLERVIPTAASNKKISAFFFENKSGDPSLDFLRVGVPYGMFYDLMQDMMIVQSSSFVDIEAILKVTAGGDPFELALPEQRKLAKDSNAPNFFSGEFTKKGADFEVISRLYNTQSGKVIKEQKKSGPDLMAIIDFLTAQLRRDLGVPEYHIEQTTDLPIGELLTDQLDVYADFINGLSAVVYNNDYITAVKLEENAVKNDPDFGMCWFLLMQHYANGTQPEKSAPAMERTMQLINKFPERLQFMVKTINYVIKQEPEKALRVTEMWSELYPTDVTATQSLAQAYQQRGHYDKAIVILEKAIEYNDNSGEFLKSLGYLYTRSGNFDKAHNYFEKLDAKYPGNEGASLSANLYRTSGNYDEALKAYDRILLMEPNNVKVLCNVASITQRKGDFYKSLELYKAALNSCKTPQEKTRCLSAIQYTYQSLLQYRKALEWHAKSYEESIQYNIPMNTGFTRIEEILYNIWIGDTLEGARIRDEIAATFSSIFEDAVGYPMGAFAAAVKDSVMSIEALEKVIRFENAYSVSPEFSINIKLGLDEARNDYKSAINRLEEFMDLQPGITVGKNVELARYYRLEGDLAKAEKCIKRLFEIYPGNLDGNFEHARILYAQGKIGEASKALDYTLSFWKDADPEAADYREAIELRSTLDAKMVN